MVVVVAAAVLVVEEEVALLGQQLVEVGRVDVLVFYLSLVLEESCFVACVLVDEVVLP